MNIDINSERLDKIDVLVDRLESLRAGYQYQTHDEEDDADAGILVDRRAISERIKSEMRLVKLELRKMAVEDRNRAIAEVCVMKKLPGGDPCWMARTIASYLKN